MLQRLGWGAATLALSGMVLLVLPGQQVRLAGAELKGLVGSYLYETSSAIFLGGGVSVTDVRRQDPVGTPACPAQVKVAFGANRPSGWVSWSVELYRNPTQWVWTGPNAPVANDGAWGAPGAAEIWDDVQLDTEYHYRVRMSGCSADSLNLPSPPTGANDVDIHRILYGDGMAGDYIKVAVSKAEASDAQTCDARWDPRFSTWVYKDFLFGNANYRGGLYAGFNNDASQVGRSFLKTTVPALPTGQTISLSSLNAFYTRSATTGSTTVGCYAAANNWSESALKWTNQPTTTTPDPLKTSVVTDTAHSTDALWCSWPVSLTGQPSTDNSYSWMLASTNESAAGWAYFARKQWNSAYAPCLLYVRSIP